MIKLLWEAFTFNQRKLRHKAIPRSCICMESRFNPKLRFLGWLTLQMLSMPRLLWLITGGMRIRMKHSAMKTELRSMRKLFSSGLNQNFSKKVAFWWVSPLVRLWRRIYLLSSVQRMVLQRKKYLTGWLWTLPSRQPTPWFKACREAGWQAFSTETL